jgi:hypothetical protein
MMLKRVAVTCILLISIGGTILVEADDYKRAYVGTYGTG